MESLEKKNYNYKLRLWIFHILWIPTLIALAVQLISAITIILSLSFKYFDLKIPSEGVGIFFYQRFLFYGLVSIFLLSGPLAFILYIFYNTRLNKLHRLKDSIKFNKYFVPALIIVIVLAIFVDPIDSLTVGLSNLIWFISQ